MDRQKEKELVHQQRLQLDRIDEGQTPNDPNNVSLDLSHQNYAVDSSEKFMKRERSFSQSGGRSQERDYNDRFANGGRGYAKGADMSNSRTSGFVNKKLYPYDYGYDSQHKRFKRPISHQAASRNRYNLGGKISKDSTRNMP